MKISVIMPVYNGEASVGNAIDSILSQTFSDFEFIIINDGSTDNTACVVKRYQEADKRIIFIEQQNCGLTVSLNRAIKLAKGQYVARQDADDISLKERFQCQLELLERQGNIGFVGSNYGLIDKDGRLFDFGYIRSNSQDISRRLKLNNVFCHGSIMFRRKVLEAAGRYRDFFKYAQDYDLYLRLIESSLPGSVNKVLYYRRLLLGSISISKYPLQSAYALLAKKCCEERLAGRDDNLILNDKYLDNLMEHSDSGNLSRVFLESLYCLNDKDVKKSRSLIRGFLFPLSLEKWKIYFLWLFTYLPGFLRDIIFAIRINIRRIKFGLQCGYLK